MGQRRLSRCDRFAPRSYIPHAQQAVHDEVGGGVDARELPFGAVASELRNATAWGLFAEEYVDSWLNPCDMPSLNAAPARLYVLSTR